MKGLLFSKKLIRSDIASNKFGPNITEKKYIVEI
jgi:hypothetical protein